MQLSGYYFEYDGQLSRRWDLKILNLNTEPFHKTSGDISYQTSYRKSSKSHQITAINYDEANISFETEILSPSPITPFDAIKIKQWLFNRPNYCRLYEDLSTDTTRERINGMIKRSYVDCVFFNPEEIIKAGGLYGWKCTCMVSTNMALQEEISCEFTDFSQPIDITVDTHIPDYVYPRMIITVNNEDTDIVIINQTDSDRDFKVNEIKATTTLYVDNEIGIIADDTDKSYYSKLANQKFLRLLPGKNTLAVTGNIAKIEFTWQNARWFK